MLNIKTVKNGLTQECIRKFESILNAIKFKNLRSTKEELFGTLNANQDKVIFDFNDPEVINAYNSGLSIMTQEKFGTQSAKQI